MENLTYLNKDEIKTYLKNKIEVEVYSTLDSTSTYARQISSEKDNDFLIACESQSCGRGRRHKSFISKKGSIYFTIGLKYNKNIDIDYITIISCIACVNVLEELNIDLKIKWVNDLFYKNKKCGGILSELIRDENNNPQCLLIGIGINLMEVALDDSIEQIACALPLNKDKANYIIGNIVDQIYKLLSSPIRVIMDKYRSRSLLLNQKIDFMIDDKPYKGIVRDFSDKGYLVIESEDGIKILKSGEVSISSKYISQKLQGK